MKKKDRDNLCNNLNSVLHLINCQFKIALKYNIHITCIRDLISISDNYIKRNKASTPSSLIVNGNYSGSSYTSIYIRVNIMIEKGLINNIGKGNRMLLIPTELAIQELQKLVSIDENNI